MDLASVVAALASVGVRVSGSTPNNNIQGDSSRACPTGLAGPEPSGTHNDPGQHFHARVSEYVCDLEYLFSRMNVRSYGATEPHLWLMSKIPQRTWDDCRATSERKSRTHSYDELVDLLIELALERENDSHMEKFLKNHLGRGGTPTPERGEGKGPTNPANANQGGGKSKKKSLPCLSWRA